MATLDVQNLTYQISTKDPNIRFPKSLFSKPESKDVLKNITVNFGPGLTAILGPSGCGKTSLLDCLAGRKNEDNIRVGRYTVNSKKVDFIEIRHQIGYVPQDDNIAACLTVKENLKFSVDLRTNESNETKENRVNKTIKTLHLTRCQNTKIGDEFIRGVSGGERKRTAIGMELVVDPEVLFLDEPTTGIDASTSLRIMQSLKTISKKKTIIMSIHQPRSSIFNLFENLVLMKNGHIVFTGTVEQALKWLEQIGYPCDDYENPADHILDVLNRKDFNIARCSIMNPINEKQYSKGSKLIKQQSFFHQTKHLCARSAKNTYRHPQKILQATVLSAIFGIFFGILFYRIDIELCNNVLSSVQNRIGFMTMMLMNTLMSATMLADILMKDEVLFKREIVGGYYTAGPYFIAKAFVELLPLRYINMIPVVLIAYFMSGLVRTASAFFRFALPVLNLAGISGMLILFVASVSTDINVVQGVFILCVILFVCTVGFFANLSSIPWVFRWIKYINFMRYTWLPMVNNEFNELVKTGGNVVKCNQICYSNKSIFSWDGSECNYEPHRTVAYEMGDIDLIDDLAWQYWQNIVILVGIGVVLLILSFIGFSRKSKAAY